MKPPISLKHEFVEYIPEQLADNTIYISIPYATAAHKCACGCGREVVTPLSPTDWKLIFDGDTVSLDPSIGNWNFECKSHYWILNDKIQWSYPWSQKQIDAGRAVDRALKKNYFVGPTSTGAARTPAKAPVNRSLWQKLTKWRSR